MQVYIIIGPQAVGKMTVGKALSKTTGAILFHNHVSIEPALQLYEYGTPSFRRLSEMIRNTVFDEALLRRHDLIFTYICAFDVPEDKAYLEALVSKFESGNATVFVVELEADFATRHKRNITELRLQEKPSKRDVESSRNRLDEAEKKYRMNSYESELNFKNYIRINNTHLEPDDVVETIVSMLE